MTVSVKQPFHAFLSGADAVRISKRSLRLFLPAPILADPLRRGPLGGEAGVTGIDEQNQAIDVRMGAIGILDLLNDVDAGVRVRDTRRIERLEEVVVADECPVPN